MAWVLHQIVPGSAVGNEEWRGFELPLLPQVKAYGFRLTPPAAPYPTSWQFAGYWQVCVITPTVAQISPVQTLSAFNNPDIPCITTIGQEQVVETDEIILGLFVLVSVNRWIPSRDVEIWLQV